MNQVHLSIPLYFVIQILTVCKQIFIAVSRLSVFIYEIKWSDINQLVFSLLILRLWVVIIYKNDLWRRFRRKICKISFYLKANVFPGQCCKNLNSDWSEGTDSFLFVPAALTVGDLKVNYRLVLIIFRIHDHVLSNSSSMRTRMADASCNLRLIINML